MNEKPDDLLTPAEVAKLLRVSAKTLGVWARAGLIPAIKTPGGHRRYKRCVADALRAGKPVRVTTAPESSS